MCARVYWPACVPTRPTCPTTFSPPAPSTPGILLSEAEVADVEVSDCRADLAALHGARLEDVRMAGCDLRGSDWQGARLRRVVLEDCDLSGADLGRARFDGVDLVRCRLDGLRDVRELRGVRMTVSDVVANAVLFAVGCGVQVVDG